MKLLMLSLLLASHSTLAAVRNSDSWLTMGSYLGIGDGQITNQMSFCFWATREPLTSSPQGMFISKGVSLTKLTQFCLGLFDTNGFDFFFYRSGNATVSQWRTSLGAYLNTNTLDFIALSFNFSDSASLKLYVNGALISGSWISGTPTNGPANNTEALEVANGRVTSSPCGGGNRIDGYYSEVAIWDTVLTADDFERIRKSHIKGFPKQVRTSNLRCYLPLDNCPDRVTSIPITDSNPTKWPERQTFGNNFAYSCTAAGSDPVGAGERICSYYPNE